MSRSYGIALFWLQKISCSLSATGSLMIISQVSRSRFNRSKPQQRLILGLSISDLCTSTIWILTPLFMPAEAAPWAVGNQTTCNMQGFIVTLFNASAILYMVALQLQYLLTIKFGWTERRIREVEPWMHGFPWFLGLSAAIAQLALKLFNPADWDCWIAPYPAGCTSSHDVKKGGTGLTETDCIRGDNAEIYRWSFFFAPLWASILFCIVAMILIYRAVREKEQKGLRHTIRRYDQMSDSLRKREKKRKSMLVQTQKVKTQCFLYAGGFFVVWTFPTIARLIQLLGGTIHPIIGVLAGTFIGIQGFFNAMIYFRPRYNAMERTGRLAKMWALVSSTLLFCWYDETRGSKFDSDYMKPPASARSSTRSSLNSKSPLETKPPDEETAAKDPEIEMITNCEPEEAPSMTITENNEISFVVESSKTECVSVADTN